MTAVAAGATPGAHDVVPRPVFCVIEDLHRSRSVADDAVLDASRPAASPSTSVCRRTG